MKIIRKIKIISIVLVAMLLFSSCNKDKKTVVKPLEKKIDNIHKVFERGPVKVIIDIDKKTISIANRLNLKISVISNEDYDVKLPAFGDKLEQFGIVDYHTSLPELLKNNRKKIIRSYILEPFLSGKYKIPPMKIQFSQKGKQTKKEHIIETEEIEIMVSSILPEKMKNLKINDIFPPVEIPLKHNTAIWIIILVILIVSIVSGIFIWKRCVRKIDVIEKEIKAHIIAYQHMETLIKKDLIEKGEIKQFYQEISNILRIYIENRFGFNAPEQTTEEFLQELNNQNSLKAEYKKLLKIFLTHCDLVKFAEHQPTNNDIQNTFDSCKNFIQETAEKEE